ncbi:MAG: glycosyltransferase, partial [Verrucomicrobiae bacterium]|nr:glycosyltransferase [Verrucomicrobiae bacterium]
WVKSGPLYPLNTGGRKRTHAMLVELSRHHQVTYLANLPEGQNLAPEESDAPYAGEKLWIASREPREGSLAWILDLVRNLLFSTLPFVLDRYRNRELSETLLELDESGRFDLIVCDFLTPAVNFEFDRIRTPVVLFQHNVEARIWERLAAEKSNPLVRLLFRDQARRMREAEISLSAKFHGVIAVSPEDAADFRDDYGLDNVLGDVPTGVDTDFFRPPTPRRPEPGLIGFLGSMDWMPNIECVHHFVRDILPAIVDRVPGARLLVIGRDPAPSLQRLATENERALLTGTVDDVRPHLDRCEVLVVPLRSGGGTRIKIFEAMAQGVPVVSTTIGAEGLPVPDGEAILIADEPEAFANSVVELLQSPERAERLATLARGMLVQNHSWAIVANRFLSLNS